MAAQRMVAKRWNEREPGKHILGNAPVIAADCAVGGFTIASAVQRESKRIFFNVKNHVAIGLDEVHRPRPLVHWVVVDRELVHVGHMRGVDPALDGLKVIAFLQAL